MVQELCTANHGACKQANLFTCDSLIFLYLTTLLILDFVIYITELKAQEESASVCFVRTPED